MRDPTATLTGSIEDPVCGMTVTDVAMSSAEVTLVRCDLRGIVVARAISKATVVNMKQNLAFAFVYNALGVPLAAGALYPFTGWLLPPMFAALAMSLSSVSVVGNALRLRTSRGADARSSASTVASPPCPARSSASRYPTRDRPSCGILDGNRSREGELNVT